jgi:hypothetical protein
VQLAAAILRERLSIVVRDGFGASSIPEILFYRHPIQRDLAFVKMLTFFPPGGLKQLTDGSLRLAAKLAEKGVTAEELSRAREAALAQAEAEMRDGNWWLREVVAVAQSRPAVLDAARQRRSNLSAISLQEVNTAARVFTTDRVTVAHLLPQRLETTSVAPKK